MPAQLPLDLPHRPALGREDFLVAEANQTAVAWIDLWPSWPQPALVLHGPAGSGKTHLAQVWRHTSAAAEADATRLLAADPPDLLGDGTELLLDDADRVIAEARDRAVVERRLLHLYNVVRERGGHLLLTARSAPARWELALPDLRSRLQAATCAELGAPDDQLIQAVLIKLFADRQLRVAPEVVRFLLLRMERSFAEAERIVDALDAASLAERKEITVPLARQVLNADIGGRFADENDNGAGESDDGSGDRG
ncbi:HdaA/DnaA family protein [Rhodovibrio salinarum]|uniref:DNA replication protein n=1 Tax=Rhodovibrio salinarum TaxID=1087 RepID=A0A934QIQ0_9PROT|nr:DnaA/Hda family protein [Rhodovibrio salinarum]MBK1697518.1 DNA replication protein [Rhodovibrio salinarum]